MNDLYRDSMAAAVDRLYAEKDEIRGVVVTSAKKTFFAGGNLHAMVQAGPDDAGDVFALAQDVKAGLRRLELLGRPVVAAVNGAALGGGLEIALACHHRVVVDDPKVQLGLPEVTLGLLPGGGGVTRTVRMLGIADALMGVLLQGTAVQARRRPGEGSGRRAGRDPRGAGAGREGLDRGARRRPRGREAARGTATATGCPAAPPRAPSWRRSCRRSRRCCALSSRAPTCRPRRRSSPPRSRAPRSTSRPRPGSSRATSPS